MLFRECVSMQCPCVYHECLCFRFCSEGDTYRIGFYVFEDFSFFELEAMPFWYRLLEPMNEQIGYQMLIKC